MHRAAVRGATILILALWTGFATYSATGAEKSPAVTSRVVKADNGERVLVQEAWLDAPVAKVWKAYTTEEGWTAWAAPQAKIDLRVNGNILTRYDVTGKIGEPGTNALTILNYVPDEILTLRADVSENWPEVLKKDADKLSNVIVFHRVSDTRTQVRSYGIGYSDAPELDELLKFFTKANEGLLKKLKVYVETGKRSTAK